ncbi:MAG TPA: phage holin family protein [Chloroflexia bacterium]|nr:phage holin family protein [Chloroflexia bacterium]
MNGILGRWAVTIIAVFVAAKLVPGIHYDSWLGLALFAAVLGLANAVVRPIVTILALPVVLLTLGLALLVINALMFLLAAAIVPDFRVDGFLAALVGSIVVSVVGWLISIFLPN